MTPRIWIFVVLAATVSATEVTPQQAHVLRSHLNEYAVSLLHQLSDENGQVTLVASPFAILTALAMLMPESTGNTETEIKEAFYCHLSHRVSNDDLRQMFNLVFCLTLYQLSTVY